MTTTLAPRPVYSPIEHRYRSVDVAREVCQGRFTHAGATVSVGLPPPWRQVDLHQDREWWIEWIKFYYGLDLGYAHATTGEQGFAETWERLVRSWIADVPPSLGPTDATGRRLQNWVYAWTAFTRADRLARFTPGFEDELTASILAQADHLQANLTAERNHRTLELYALLVVALALPHIDLNGARARFAWAALHDNLLMDVRPDGVHREHSTHYHMVALRSFLAARENARRFGLPVPPGFDDRLARAVEFGMACQRADGSIPALSDSDTDDHRDCLTLAASLLDRADVRFVATDGREGSGPASSLTEFPCGGYFIQRSAWSTVGGPAAEQRHLVFDCGSIGDGGHGHYDLLSIDAWAGRPILVDPGRYTYNEGTPNLRRWFKSTQAHNTVNVDGLDQTAYRVGKPKKPAAPGRRVTSLRAPGLEVVGGEARSHEYEAVHTRHVFFVDGDYWVIVDHLSGHDLHTYDLRYHLPATAWGRVGLSDRAVVAPGLRLLFDGPGELTLEDGWIAPSYGVKHPAPVVSLRGDGLRDARFVTAVLPLAETGRWVGASLSVEDPEHGTTVARITVSDRGGVRTDRLTWTRDDAAGPSEGVFSISRATWCRTAPDGAVLRGATAAAVAASEIDNGGDLSIVARANGLPPASGGLA